MAQDNEFRLPTKEELKGMSADNLKEGVAVACEGMRLGWQGYFRQVMTAGAYLWEERRRHGQGKWQRWCNTNYPDVGYTSINNYINLYDWYHDKDEDKWPKNGIAEGLAFIREAKAEAFKRDFPAQALVKEEESARKKRGREEAKEKDTTQRRETASSLENLRFMLKHYNVMDDNNILDRKKLKALESVTTDQPGDLTPEQEEEFRLDMASILAYFRSKKNGLKHVKAGKVKIGKDTITMKAGDTILVVCGAEDATVTTEDKP